jgi:L-lactate utilization protein LutB
MFDQIKLPVCRECGAHCSQCNVYRAATGSHVKVVLRFVCGAVHSQTTEEDGECKYIYDSLNRGALDAARQRHAEVRVDVTERLKAAQDEQGKGYGTSV